jgi:hypothetical protein
MKKIVFIALFGSFFLVACSNQKRSKETPSGETTEQVTGKADDENEEAVEAIDDSGEISQDSIIEVDSE